MTLYSARQDGVTINTGRSMIMILNRTLDNLSTGQSARISNMTVGGGIRRRMQDIGFLDGVIIKCLFRGISGEPAAFLINGAVIALRREEMCRILIQPVDDNDQPEAANEGCAAWG